MYMFVPYRYTYYLLPIPQLWTTSSCLVSVEENGSISKYLQIDVRDSIGICKYRAVLTFSWIFTGFFHRNNGLFNLLLLIGWFKFWITDISKIRAVENSGFLICMLNIIYLYNCVYKSFFELYKPLFCNFVEKKYTPLFTNFFRKSAGKFKFMLTVIFLNLHTDKKLTEFKKFL